MAPPTKKSVEDMFAALTAQLDVLASVPSDIASLKALVVDLKKENSELRAQLQERDTDYLSLKNHVNNMDLHNRSWSVRLFNLPIPPADAKNNFRVAQIAYETAILPILRGAVSKGDISEVPPCHQLLERAHILPGLGGKPGSVIARFLNRDYRSLLFKHKREFQPRSPPPSNSSTASSSSSPPLGRYLYPIYEDLTKATFSKMRALAAHPSVLAAWTSNGVIRFRLENDSSSTIHRVSNVYNSVEQIITI